MDLGTTSTDKSYKGIAWIILLRKMILPTRLMWHAWYTPLILKYKCTMVINKIIILFWWPKEWDMNPRSEGEKEEEPKWC